MTQYEKILVLMIQHRDLVWWKASDIIKRGSGDLYVGYEATARMSELSGNYPELLEVGKDGRFRTLRLRTENLKLGVASLGQEKPIVIRELNKVGLLSTAMY